MVRRMCYSEGCSTWLLVVHCDRCNTVDGSAQRIVTRQHLGGIGLRIVDYNPRDLFILTFPLWMRIRVLDVNAAS